MFHHPIPTQKPQVSWQSWTLELWPVHHFHLIWLQKPSGSNPSTVSEGTANPPSHVTIPQSHFLSEGRAGSIGFINLFIFGYNPTSHYNPIMIPLGCWNSHIFLGHIPLSHQKIPLGSWETNSGQENLQGSRKKNETSLGDENSGLRKAVPRRRVPLPPWSWAKIVTQKTVKHGKWGVTHPQKC